MENNAKYRIFYTRPSCHINTVAKSDSLSNLLVEVGLIYGWVNRVERKRKEKNIYDVLNGAEISNILLKETRGKL